MVSSSVTAAGLAFLDGDGEMAELMRAHDWAATPLGPPAGWRPTLKAMVRMALATRHPVFIFWGAALTCLYNDAYKASIGPEKHPAILGMRGEQAWPEIWHIIGPQIEMVLRGEGATWHENQLVPIIRHGRLEDVYWTYSFGPIDDDEAPQGVGGVLVLCTETTQQILAEQRLKDQRTHFQRLFEQAPTFMAMLSGPRHVFEAANPRYRRLVGDRDILGQAATEALPEAAAQGYVELLDHVYRTGEPYVATAAPYVMQRTPGEPGEQRFLDFVYQPVRDEAGTVSGIFVEGVDVTDRHSAERALRESNERLQLATEAAEVGHWDLDLVHGHMYWPTRVRAMFGISPDAPVSMQDFHDGLHPEDRDATIRAFEAAQAPSARPSYDVEYRTIGREDGVLRWVAAKGRGVFDAEGRCLRVIGTAIDITARRAVERELRSLNETLELRIAEALAERKILADVIEGTDALVQVADTQLHLLAINQAAQQGWQRVHGTSGAVGDRLATLLAAPAEHGPALLSHWQRALQGESFSDVMTFTPTSPDEPGGRSLEFRFSPLRDRQGAVVGAYQFVYDVTQRQADQERLKLAEQALVQAQKMEAIGQLTGGIAHDFNNLLQSVRSNLELIRRVPEQAERVKGWAEGAMRSVERGAQLTTQLLAFSRSQVLEVKSIDVVDLLDGMQDLLRRTLGANVVVRLEVPSHELFVLGDVTQLEMAVLNLAINGRDAMPDGGTLAVAVRATAQAPDLPTGDFVEIAVQDSGTGMRPDVLARAFEPFFSTKPVGKGTGLGLSQVYGMARQARGTVHVQSTPGAGTTVSIFLRRTQIPPPGVRAPDPTRPADAALEGRVLLVDDDPEVRKAVAEALGTSGCRVFTANDGRAALAQLTLADPDVAVIDYAMPGMSGAALAHALHDRDPLLPVIFLTGFADLGAIADAVGESATVLRKPVRLDELQGVVGRMLRRRRGR